MTVTDVSALPCRMHGVPACPLCAPASPDSVAALVSLTQFLQGRRRDALRACRASAGGGSPDYWRWQGHAELARQCLERLGAEVPQ